MHHCCYGLLLGEDGVLRRDKLSRAGAPREITLSDNPSGAIIRASQKGEGHPMPRSSAALRPLVPVTPISSYSDELLAELQTTLAALADLEVQYEIDRERLEAWDGPEAIKKKFAAQLEERHQRDREPYVQRLADLHCSMIRIMTLEDICSNP